MWALFEDLALWTEAWGAHTWPVAATCTCPGCSYSRRRTPSTSRAAVSRTCNSQYIARKLNVTGGGALEMEPNAKDVVTIPILGGFSFVR